jgi:geranylgeranyl diphosphate synthase type II
MASRDSSDLDRQLTSIRERIDARLTVLVPPEDAPPEKLHRAMRYSLLAPGKRIRPTITVLTAEALGASIDLAIDPACAVEMVHAASLILDDLPIMDDANQRRGQPANHLVFGQDIAILASVSLLNRAYAVLSQAPGLDDEPRLALVGELTSIIGDGGIVSGQVQDLELTGQTDPCPDALELMARQKTGALFDVCARLGAVVAGVTGPRRAAVRAFAGNLGLCFQVMDDLADAHDAETPADRPRAEDHSKATFVSLMGPERAQQLSEKLIRDAIRALEPIGTAADALAGFANHVFESTQRITPQR